MIKDMIVENITGRVVDGAIDGTIDAVKERNALNTTYVWTAINKETHSGKIANIIFVNKLGQRRRVQYDALPEFCLNHYVSNIIVNDGRISAVGISLYDLPDYRLMPNGQYQLHGRYNEQYIYNKALAYIQSEERKIQEDFANKCLKGNKDSGGTQSNATANISAMRDISMATAVTAVTAAGAATAVGIGAGAKAIYKQVNKKKLVEIQEELYGKLKNYKEITEALVQTKLITNDKIKSNSSIREYTNEFEANNDRSGKIKGTLRQSGVVGCVNKIHNLINQVIASAQSNGVYDEPLNIQGRRLGTLHSYSDGILSRIEYAKELHLETKQLIDNNIHKENQRVANENYIEQLREREIAARNELNRRISQIETEFSRYNTDTIGVTDINVKINRFNIINITAFEDIDTVVSSLTNIRERNLYQNKISLLRDELSGIQTDLEQKLYASTEETKREIREHINSIESDIELLISGRFEASNYNDIISNINNGISNAKIDIGNLEGGDSVLLERVNSLEAKLLKNRSNIDNSLRKAERDSAAIQNIESIISRYENDIRLAADSKEIKRLITSFGSSTRSGLYGLSTNTVEQIRARIDEKTQEFNGIMQEKEREEQIESGRMAELGNNILTDLRNDINRVQSFSIDNITEDGLQQFTIDEDGYSDRIRAHKFDSGLQRDINDAFFKLKNSYRNKYRDAETLIRTEQRAIERLESQILSLENTVNNGLTKYNKTSTFDRINGLKVSMDYTKIRDKSSIDLKISNLLNLYNEKASTIQ